MRWVRISIETCRESEDALSNLLMEMGSGGVQIEGNNSISDTRVVVTAYFAPDDMIGERVSRITRLLENMRDLDINVGAGRISLDSLDERSWSEQWKEFFRPLTIGERILVYPSWENISESLPRDILVQIDPGMAFGTGGHSTTILSLELLENVLKGGEEVADVGAGSGILAIAAVKLGAKEVVAIDVDAEAAIIARENARRNGVGDKIHVICGELLSAVNDKYDVIVSNISSKAILSMIPDLRFYLSVDGRLILSGILESEVSEIQNELERNNLMTLETRRDEEWAAVLAKASQQNDCNH
jgi:ribosomal protein L11 methyltransferase